MLFQAFVLAVAAGLSATPSNDYLNAKRKIELIGENRAPAGSRILLSSQELNAYVRTEAALKIRDGLRDPRVELGDGTASGFAYIDFPRLQQASGKPLSWFLATLLQGERPVRVIAKIDSKGGLARVDVESVEISGVSIGGSTLDFLIDRFLRPYVPDARVGEPFELKHGIERLDVRPTFVQVIMRPR